jgi:proline racemase
MIHESLIGSRFEGRIVAETVVAGRAWITGFHTYLIDPDDPWPEGFSLPDMMGVTGG